MRKPGIGRAEMEILRYVAEHQPITVREVADYVAATKGHTRTTVLNVMERLRQKGHLTREKVEGVYRYSPSVPKAQLLRSLVGDFVQQVLGGSLEPFTAYLVRDAQLTGEELADLRKAVDELGAREPEEQP